MKRLPTPKPEAQNGQPTGRYIVRWRYKLAGKEHRPRRTFRNEADANDFILRELVGESRLKTLPNRNTFDHYADKYLELLTPEVKPSTANRDRGALGHARAYFAGWPVTDIKTSDARTFRARLIAGGCTVNRRKLTRSSSVKHAYRVFRAAMDIAVDDGALPANPALLPTRVGRKSNAEPKFRPVFLDAYSVELLAGAAILQPPYGLMVRFLAYTGLRTGELAGLNIEDVHLHALRGVVDVHRTRRKIKGGWAEGTPKSERSTRRVKLPPWLAEDVANYLENEHPRGASPDAPLFPGRAVGGRTHGRARDADAPESGKRLNWSEPIEPGAFYKSIFKKALAETGLPAKTRMHDLRHTFAALWLAAGGAIYELSEQLGHESYQTTHRFYAHFLQKPGDAPHVFDARPGQPTRRLRAV